MLQLVKIHYTHVLQLVTVHIHVHMQTCLTGKITHTRASAGNRGYAHVLHVAKSAHTHVVLFIKTCRILTQKAGIVHGMVSAEMKNGIFLKSLTSYCCASYSRITF